MTQDTLFGATPTPPASTPRPKGRFLGPNPCGRTTS